MDNKQAKTFIFIGLVLLIFIVLNSFNPFIIINEGDRGVVRTLGRISNKVMEQGLNFKKPFVDEVFVISVRPQTVEGDAPTYTKDNQPIDISFKVIYTIPETDLPNTVARYQGMPYEKYAAPKVLDAIKAIGGRYTASEFVTEREKVRIDLVDLARKSVTDNKTNRPAVNIIDIPLTNVDFDDEYEKAIKEKQVMQQKAEQKRYELQAAQQDAQITITRSLADAKAIQVKADALKASPQLVEFEKVNMMREKWDGKLPDTMVMDGKSNIMLPVK